MGYPGRDHRHRNEDFQERGNATDESPASLEKTYRKVMVIIPLLLFSSGGSFDELFGLSKILLIRGTTGSCG